VELYLFLHGVDSINFTLLGAFALSRKASITFLVSARLSVTGIISVEFDIVGFNENLSRKSKFGYNQSKYPELYVKNSVNFILAADSKSLSNAPHLFVSLSTCDSPPPPPPTGRTCVEFDIGGCHGHLWRNSTFLNIGQKCLALHTPRLTKIIRSGITFVSRNLR